MPEGLQNAELSFEQLYDEAKASVSVLDNHAGSILDDLKVANPELFADVEFDLGPLKELDRATQKIEGDYKGDHSKIADLVRGRFVVDNPEQIEAIRTYLEENAEKLGIEVKKDRFAKPSDTHFRDVNMKIRLPNGHVAELRVEHKGLLEAAKYTHEPYERVQDIERRAELENRPLTEAEEIERQKIMEGIRDIHDNPANADNLDRFLNEAGQTKVDANNASRLTPFNPNALDEAIAGAKAAGVAADGIKLSSKALKVSVAGGVAVTGGVAAVLHYAHDKQRELAETLKDNGQLSEEAYQEYVELNQEIEANMQAENVAAQGWLFIASTPVVEARARAVFEEFSNKHNLSQEVHEALGMSLFDGDSIRGELADNTFDTIPDNTADAPEALHALVEAKGAVNEAQEAYNTVYKEHFDTARKGLVGVKGGYALAKEIASRNSEVVEAQERLDVAQSQFQYAFDDTLSNPEGAGAMAGLLDKNQLFDIVKSTAEFNSDGLDPVIQQYLDAKQADAPWYDLKGAWGNMSDRDAAEMVLKENPDIMREYVQNIFAPDAGEAPNPDLDNDMMPEEPVQNTEELIAGDFSGFDATYAGDPELAKEAAEAGVAVHPEFIPPERIAAVENTVAPQAPQV